MYKKIWRDKSRSKDFAPSPSILLNWKPLLICFIEYTIFGVYIDFFTKFSINYQLGIMITLWATLLNSKVSVWSGCNSTNGKPFSSDFDIFGVNWKW